MSEPRNHHFIPVFYLKKWATNRLLWEYKKVPGKVVSRNVGPKGTGFERDLYTFDEFPPHRAQFLEAVFLKRTDDYASKALDQLVSGEFPRTAEMRSAWSRFVYQLLVRHPDPFTEIRRAAREDWLVADVATQIEYERRRTSDMPTTFEEFITSEPGFRDDMIVSLLQSAFDNDRVGVRINTLIWHVVDLSAAAYPLLTSDWPMENALGAQNPFVALPIGPRQLFIGTHDETTIRNLRQRSPDEIVATVNGFVVSRARRYVWAVDTSQARFIENHMSRHMARPPFFPSMGRAHLSDAA